MSTQSIIVYRNPMEQAFWEGAMSAQLFPIIVGGVVAIAAVILTEQLLLKVNGYGNRRSWLGRHRSNISLMVGGIVWMLVVWNMWI